MGLLFCWWCHAALAAETLCNELVIERAGRLLSPKLQGKSPVFQVERDRVRVELKTGWGIFKRTVPAGFLTFGYFPGEKTIGVINAQVPESFRGNGIQNAMFSIMVARFPEAEVIATTNLQQTNAAAFMEGLISRMAPDYRGRSGLSSRARFVECCEEAWRRLPQSQKDQFATEAIKETPAFKTRKKFGFEKLCKGAPTFNSGGLMYNINFVVCR